MDIGELSDFIKSIRESEQNVLNHFIPLTEENRIKAIDYMDYLKSRQDPEE